MKPVVTLNQLLSAIEQDANSPEEIVATAVHMVNSGAVELAGTASGKRFDLAHMDGLDDILLAA